MGTREITICRRLCFAGIIGVIFYVLHDIIGAKNYPGYDWMSQAVSDLTATDAPSFAVAKGFSGIHGVMCIVCVLFVYVLAQRKHKLTRIGIAFFTAMEMISTIGYSLFPLSGAGYDGSVQSFIHVYVITVAVVLLSIVSLVLISIGAKKDNMKFLSIAAIVALALMFVGAIGSQAVPKEYFGILERFSTYSATMFCALLGINFGIEKMAP